MSNSIRLSPKYGVNPTIPVCFWCGEEKNEIALMGRIGNDRNHKDIEAPHYAVIDYEPCDKCRCGMSQGFTVLEATTYPNDRASVEMQKGIYPTGRFVVLKTEAADRIFGKEFTSKGKAFMTPSDFNQMFAQG